MTDQTPEPTDDAPGAGIFATANTATVKSAIENVLDLDAILSSARRVERTAFINSRGDLEDAYNQAISELASIVNEEGEVDTEGDASLADVTRAEELSEQATDLRKQIKAATSTVRFRALDSDAWNEFEAAHRGKNGEIKDAKTYENDLIAACAIAPTLTVQNVLQLRQALSNNQILHMFNEAWMANTRGGLDVPKLPSYLHAPKPQE